MRLPIIHLVLSLTAVCLAAAPALAEEARKAYPDNLLVETLDNGLEVVIEENHNVPIADVRAYMRIGSMFEGEWLGSGLSHYMEHIVSGGSTRREVTNEAGEQVWVGRTEEENGRLLQGIGGYSNAKTSSNFTQYYITTKSEFVETAVDLISDYLQNCQFDAGEVAREQEVVQQELLRNLDNSGRILGSLFSEQMFKVHPVRVPVIGYQDCIQRLTPDDMQRFFKKHYTPQNCVIGIVGDVDKHETFELIKQYFGGWKRRSLEPYQIPQEPVQTGMRWSEKEHGSTRTCAVRMGVPSIELTHPDLYALDMLAGVLGANASARLPRKFEHDPQREALATGVRCGSWTPTFGAGRFYIGFGTDTLANARSLVWEMWDEAKRLKEELVTQEEIDRVYRTSERSFYMGRATVDDRCESLCSNMAWVHDPLFDETYLVGLRQVTPEQVREAAQRYLIDSRLNVSILAPPGSTATVATTADSEETGDVQKTVLDNGLTLLVKRVPGYGMVDCTAAFGGGVIHETPEKNGLHFLTANTFWRGTTSRDLNTMMREMDELGMTLSVESHNNVSFVAMQAMASEIEGAMGLYADVLQRPAIEAQWVEQIRGILLSRVLPNQLAQGSGLARKALREALYATHPYERERYGIAETVSTFTPEEVRQCYETFMRPNNCTLAVYGDVDPAQVKALVAQQFGDWGKGEVPASLVTTDPGPESSSTIELTNQQVRTNYVLGWRAPSRQEEKKAWAMTVMNGIIGTNSGWLHDRLRGGDNHYVYAVFGIPYTGDSAGHYWIETDFTPKDEADVVAIVDGVIADIKAGKFTDEELDTVKRSIQCGDALGQRENSNVCQGDALQELYGQGYDYDERRFAGIAKITRDEVVAIANEVLSGPSVRIFVRPEE